MFHAVEALETILQAIFCVEQQIPRPVVAQSRARGLVEERVESVRQKCAIRVSCVTSVMSGGTSLRKMPVRSQVAKSGSEQQEKTRVEKRRRKGKKKKKE